MDGWKITGAKVRALEPIRLDLRQAEVSPGLSAVFEAARRGGAVITEITADSLEDLKAGRITVQARGL